MKTLLSLFFFFFAIALRADEAVDLSSVSSGFTSAELALVSIAATCLTCGIAVFGVYWGARYALRLFSVNSETGSASESKITSQEYYKMWRSGGSTPADMQKMKGGWKSFY